MAKLRAVRPNLGIEAAYQRRLQQMVREMGAEFRAEITRLYWDNPPIALDKLPARMFQEALDKVTARWTKNFSAVAPRLAKYFADSVSKRNDAVLRNILKDGGLAIKFKMTQAQQDIIAATVAENVSLIKSIPEQYASRVQGSVMRAVARGGDLGSLTEELVKDYGLTYQRAALIARDQNSKAVANMTRSRNLELGITEAIWKHSRSESHPRPTHVDNSGKKFSVKDGWYDPAVGKNIWPGELINCRCVSIPVMPYQGGVHGQTKP